MSSLARTLHLAADREQRLPASRVFWGLALGGVAGKRVALFTLLSLGNSGPLDDFAG